MFTIFTIESLPNKVSLYPGMMTVQMNLNLNYI